MTNTLNLALPKQYVELEQEEMMYLDGGGIISTFVMGVFTTLVSTYLVKHGISIAGWALKAAAVSIGWVSNALIACGVTAAWAPWLAAGILGAIVGTASWQIYNFCDSRGWI